MIRRKGGQVVRKGLCEEETCKLSAEETQEARWSRGRAFQAEGTASAKASELEQIWLPQGRPMRLKLAKIDEQGRSFQIPFNHEAFTATNYNNIGVKNTNSKFEQSLSRGSYLHLIQFSWQFNSTQQGWHESQVIWV